MDHAYTLRPATPADIPTIAAQRRGMFEDMGTFKTEGIDAAMAAFPAWVAPRIERGEWLHWLAVAPDGAIAGGGSLWIMDWVPGPPNPDGRRGNILNVYVTPAHRRRGLARQIMKAILAWCAENRVSSLLLHASPDGRHLYETLGFSPSNEMRLQLPSA